MDARAPESIEEALELLAQHGNEAKLVAGGTALVIMMKQGLIQPALLIGLYRVLGLSAIEWSEAGLSVGALATHRAIETSPLVSQHAPALAETLRHVATIRIRNVATIGGNLAHADPALDPPVTLMALGARVRLVRKGGDRSLPLDEFYIDYYETVLEPDELLAEVQLPVLPPHSAVSFLKFLPRTLDDYATVATSARLTSDLEHRTCVDVRIVVGSAGPVPTRAKRAEEVLRDHQLDDAAFREAAAVAKTEVDPTPDIRGSAEYKRDMTEVFVRRALEQARDRLIGQREARA